MVEMRRKRYFSCQSVSIGGIQVAEEFALTGSGSVLFVLVIRKKYRI